MSLTPNAKVIPNPTYAYCINGKRISDVFASREDAHKAKGIGVPVQIRDKHGKAWRWSGQLCISYDGKHFSPLSI